MTAATTLARSLALALLSVGLIAAYSGTLARVVPSWLSLSGFNSHGLLMLGLVGFLLFERRHLLLAEGPPSTPWLIGGALAASIVWLAGWAMGLNALEVLAMFLVIVCAVAALLSPGAVLAFAAPFGLLLFALPMWALSVQVLQDAASVAVGAMLSSVDLIIFIEGNEITTPEGIFEIADSCSGLSFLLAAFSISGFLALIHECTWQRYVVLTALSVLMALFINWVRIVLIVLAGYYGGMDHPLVTEHVTFGWGVFAVMYLPFLWFSLRLVGEPRRTERPDRQPGRVTGTRLGAVLIVSLAVPIAATTIENLAVPVDDTVTRLPQYVDGAAKQEVEIIWSPYFADADYRELAGYDVEGELSYVYTAFYAEQGHSREVVNNRNNFYGKNWKLVSEGQADAEAPIAELQLRGRDTRHMLVWHWYMIGNAQVASDFDAKLRQVDQRLAGRRDARVMVLASLCASSSDCNGARSRLQRLRSGLAEASSGA